MSTEEPVVPQVSADAKLAECKKREGKVKSVIGIPTTLTRIGELEVKGIDSELQDQWINGRFNDEEGEVWVISLIIYKNGDRHYRMTNDSTGRKFDIQQRKGSNPGRTYLDGGDYTYIETGDIEYTLSGPERISKSDLWRIYYREKQKGMLGLENDLIACCNRGSISGKDPKPTAEAIMDRYNVLRGFPYELDRVLGCERDRGKGAR
ncbi:MAG: hypothetical protein FWC53_02080 [Firmicutes bacterium]|nr:hypothetical protein [Bacillota bacterium]